MTLIKRNSKLKNLNMISSSRSSWMVGSTSLSKTWVSRSEKLSAHRLRLKR